MLTQARKGFREHTPSYQTTLASDLIGWPVGVLLFFCAALFVQKGLPCDSTITLLLNPLIRRNQDEMFKNNIKIFSGTGHQALAQTICARLAIPLEECKIEKFLNSETA